MTRNINEFVKDTQIDNKKVFKYLRSWKPAHETAGLPDDKGVKVAVEDKSTAQNMRFIFRVFFFTVKYVGEFPTSSAFFVADQSGELYQFELSIQEVLDHIE